MTALRGTRVLLRPVVAEDKAAIVRIRSTPQVRRRWRGEDLEATTDRVVGLIQYAEVDDPDYRSAGLDVFVDPAHHRRGLASDAIRTLARHLVHDRGHHRLTIDPAADNEAAIACYAAVGFRPVGVMRDYERQADGQWADGLLMELLAADGDL